MVSPEDYKEARRPFLVKLDYRLYREYEEIKDGMEKYGVKTSLESEKEALEMAEKFGGHPYGWDHLNKPKEAPPRPWKSFEGFTKR